MLYIHIGLPKTGTTFLQEEVFPKWEGIHYLGGNKNNITLKELLEMENDKSYLISKEYISNINRLSNLAEMVPDAKIVIGFRKHHQKIISGYKQKIQGSRAMDISFDEYFDIVNNTGMFKLKKFDYKNRINLIENQFHCKPFVFLQEELFDNIEGLLKDLEDFMGGTAPDTSMLSGKKSNKGIGYHQSILLRKWNQLFESPKGYAGIIPYNKHTWYVREVIKYLIQNHLTFFPNKPIKMDDKQRKLTNIYYREDWNFVLDYIKTECPYRNNFDDSSYR